MASTYGTSKSANPVISTRTCSRRSCGRHRADKERCPSSFIGGASRDRTDDLIVAKAGSDSVTPYKTITYNFQLSDPVPIHRVTVHAAVVDVQAVHVCTPVI